MIIVLLHEEKMKRKLFIQATQQHKYQFLETGKLNIKQILRNI